MGLLLNKQGSDLVIKDKYGHKVLNVFFSTFFTGKIGIEQSQAPDTSGKVDLPSVYEKQVEETFKQAEHKYKDLMRQNVLKPAK